MSHPYQRPDHYFRPIAMRFFLLLYPWLELLSLIQLGIETSALTALAWVAAMIVLGSVLLRQVGMANLNRLREAQQGRVVPAPQQLLLRDMAVTVAALLLIIPGLVSDVLAVVFLIGPLRRLLGRVLGVRVTGDAGSPPPERPAERGPVTLEGEYRRLDDHGD